MRIQMQSDTQTRRHTQADTHAIVEMIRQKSGRNYAEIMQKVASKISDKAVF